MRSFLLRLILLLGVTLSSTQAPGQVPATSTVSAHVAAPLKVTLPLKEGSVRFLIIGDTGSGSSKQQQVAEMMTRYRAFFRFEFVLMLGDNLYGGESPQDYDRKFANIYKQLLDDKVKFYATLGNHDQSNQIFYGQFNMNGKEYYRFTKGDVAFYSLNSNYMDGRQVKWLEEELAKDTSKWKICFFHHPLYSSGKKHGPSTELREIIEPIFMKYGVDLVLSGHDHFYERIKPQHGIYYIISGAAGKLRVGGVKPGSPLTDKAFDRDMHFVAMEVVDDQLYFQTVSRTGDTVDSGVFALPSKK